jgi:ATP-dependent protease Clp ATPase subunit
MITVLNQEGTSGAQPYRCSFCSQPKLSLSDFIWGPEVRICRDCVDICNDIVAEQRIPEGTPPDVRVHCVLCRLEWSQTEAVAVPKKGWLCRDCFAEVRSLATSVQEPTR